MKKERKIWDRESGTETKTNRKFRGWPKETRRILGGGEHKKKRYLFRTDLKIGLLQAGNLFLEFRRAVGVLGRFRWKSPAITEIAAEMINEKVPKGVV